MTRKVIFTPGARKDLIELYTYIADKSDSVRAESYIRRIERSCLSFSTFPFRGTQRDDVRPGLRTTGFERRATIAFHIEGKIVYIDRVLYGGRSLEKAFDADDE